MKKIIVMALLALPYPAHAAFLCSDPAKTCYFRPIDFGNIHQSASSLIDPHDPGATTALVTDIAVFTHDTKDGSIIPEGARGFLPPEDWAFAVGGGGSLQKDFIVDANFTVNVAPQVGAAVFAKVGSGSPPWLQGTKALFLGTSQYGQVRLGWALAGNIVKGGVFQSACEAFPGAGILDIFNRGSRAVVGYSWEWGAPAKK